MQAITFDQSKLFAYYKVLKTMPNDNVINELIEKALEYKHLDPKDTDSFVLWDEEFVAIIKEIEQRMNRQ